MQSVCERTPLNIKLDPEVIANIRTRTDEIVAEMATDGADEIVAEMAGSCAGDVAVVEPGEEPDEEPDEEPVGVAVGEEPDVEPVGVAVGVPSKSPNVHWVKKDKTFVAKRHNAADDTWSYKRFRCFAPHMQSMMDASHGAAVKWATGAADCS